MLLQPSTTRQNRLHDAGFTEKLRKGLGFKAASSAELTTTCTKKTLDDPLLFLELAKGMDIILHTHHTLASDSFASQHTLHTVLPNSLACFPSVSMTISELNRAAQVFLKAAAAEAETDAGSPARENDLKFITVEEACEIAHVERWKIAEWLNLKDEKKKPLIRSFKLGSSRNSRVRIDKASFIAFLESMIR